MSNSNTWTKLENCFAEYGREQVPLFKSYYGDLYIKHRGRYTLLQVDDLGNTFFEKADITAYVPLSELPKCDGIAARYFANQNNPAPSTLLHTEEGFTKGEWQVSLARWAKEAPVIGFVIRMDKKDITGFGVHTTHSSVFPDDYFDKMPDLWQQHCTASECEANAHLIAAAKDMYYALKGITEGYFNGGTNQDTERLMKSALDVLQKANPKL